MYFYIIICVISERTGHSVIEMYYTPVCHGSDLLMECPLEVAEAPHVQSLQSTTVVQPVQECS